MKDMQNRSGARDAETLRREAAPPIDGWRITHDQTRNEGEEGEVCDRVLTYVHRATREEANVHIIPYTLEESEVAGYEAETVDQWPWDVGVYWGSLAEGGRVGGGYGTWEYVAATIQEALGHIAKEAEKAQPPPVGLREDLECPSCGRDFASAKDDEDIYPGAPCPSDECPSHWEDRGVPFDDYDTETTQRMQEQALRVLLAWVDSKPTRWGWWRAKWMWWRAKSRADAFRAGRVSYLDLDGPSKAIVDARNSLDSTPSAVAAGKLPGHIRHGSTHYVTIPTEDHRLSVVFRYQLEGDQPTQPMISVDDFTSGIARYQTQPTVEGLRRLHAALGVFLLYTPRRDEDFEAICQRCTTTLLPDGLCNDLSCPFSSYQQDDVRGWAGHPNPPTG